MRNAFAVACTGRGEHFIRSNFAGALSRRLFMSIDLERGFRKVFADSSHNNGGVGSVLALVCTPLENEDDKKALRRVQLGAAFTTLVWVWVTCNVVLMLRQKHKYSCYVGHTHRQEMLATSSPFMCHFFVLTQLMTNNQILE
ncbi:unnamed protein product [Peronospora belbahrii]|uniref:Uncharacterized protein n=1 Tax=Peronospora belbahrii TaxID=622444 RepID=A0ABN8CNQ2_9STRA|nr:unnamed protein product [Peronospora belbahrii]